MASQQEQLFHETWEEVLNDLILALGGHKRVAGELWPSLAQPTAYARIKACLSPDKPEKFSPGEVIWLLRRARAKGLHLGMHWLCDELGYSRPAPIEPKDQEAEIARHLDTSIENLEGLLARVERIRAAKS